MIPLMYVLPSDEVYTPASGVVTKITPNYSHYRHSIQVEFKYNLDEFFYLEIGLNEFDQPSSVSLYGFYSSRDIQMADLVPEYHLIGKKVAVVLTKEVILEIANNLVTPSGFEAGATIEFNIIQDKQNIEDRAIISKINVLAVSLELKINTQEVVYSIGGKKTSYQPTLETPDGVMTPASVDGHYNIFDLDGVNIGLTLVIIPPQDFENHYLFRQQESIGKMSMFEDGTVSAGGASYFYNNGIMEYFGISISMQEFLVHSRGEEYKTYLFNAARDKNLYSEITLLFPAVQHNSMTIYDLEANILIKGSVDYYAEIDSETDKLLHCVSMTKCRDFFGRKVNKKYVFKFLPAKVLSASILSVKNGGEIGSFYVTDLDTGNVSVVPVDARTLDQQKTGYLTASNMKYSASIKKTTLIKHSELMRGDFKTFKAITDGDFLSPLYRFDTIDFEQEELTVRNGTRTIVKGLAEKNALVISTGSSRLDTKDHMSDFGGVQFAVSPDSITTSGINITNFSDYVMLCRMVELPTYGVAGVRRDTKDLLYTVMFSYRETDIVAIYNPRFDKIYYINFAKKETVVIATNFPHALSKYITNVDEEKLKSFLLNGATGTYRVSRTANSSYTSMTGDKLYSEDVMHEKFLDENRNITSLISSSLGLTTYGVLAESDTQIGAYIPRPGEISVMKNGFGSNLTIFRKAFTGIYANKPISMISVLVSAAVFTVMFKYDGEVKTSVFSIDGGAIEFKNGLKQSIHSEDESFSYMSACTYSSDVNFEKTYQHNGLIVIESAFEVSLAFDIGVLERMSEEQTLGVNGTVSLSYGGRMIMMSGALGDNVSISDEIISCGDVVVDTANPTGEAKALSFNGEQGDISTTISNDEYDRLLTQWPGKGLEDNGFVSIDEFDTQETYSISFGIEKAQYLQFKE